LEQKTHYLYFVVAEPDNTKLSILIPRITCKMYVVTDALTMNN